MVTCSTLARLYEIGTNMINPNNRKRKLNTTNTFSTVQAYHFLAPFPSSKREIETFKANPMTLIFSVTVSLFSGKCQTVPWKTHPHIQWHISFLGQVSFFVGWIPLKLSMDTAGVRLARLAGWPGDILHRGARFQPFSTPKMGKPWWLDWTFRIRFMLCLYVPFFEMMILSDFVQFWHSYDGWKILHQNRHR